jgi:hypothetical protein
MDPCRPLYSAVVSENTDEIDSNKQSEDVLFGTYETALNNLLNYSAIKQDTCTSPKNPLRSQMLEELAGHLALYVTDIRENLSFHGFANELELSDVMECIENNIVIDITPERNSESYSDEDEPN